MQSSCCIFLRPWAWNALTKDFAGLFRGLLNDILGEDRSKERLAELTRTYMARSKKLGKYGEKWEWKEKELREYLATTLPELSTVRPVVIYVDAVDECGKDQAITLVRYFKRLMSQVERMGAHVRLCCSCRHYPILAFNYGTTIYVEDQNDKDICHVVQAQLDDSGIPSRSGHQIEHEITTKAQGVFMWAMPVTTRAVELSMRGVKPGVICKEIHKLPRELDDLYSELLKEIDEGDRPQTIKLFRWTCFAKRPLTIYEIRDAMTADAIMETKSAAEFVKDDNYAEDLHELERRIQDLSKGLVEIKRFTYDRDTQSYVQFIHQSVVDYLLDHGFAAMCFESPEPVSGQAHFAISRSCLRYLAIEEVASTTFRNVVRRQEFPLAMYAALFSSEHIEAVENAHISQDDLPNLLLSARFEKIVKYSSWRADETRISVLRDHLVRLQIWSAFSTRRNREIMEIYGEYSDGYGQLVWIVLDLHRRARLSRTSWGADHQASRNVVEKEELPAANQSCGRLRYSLPSRKHILGQSNQEQNALDWRETCIRALAGLGANLNIEDKRGQTLLTHAISKSEPHLIKTLLEVGADPDQAAPSFGSSPLPMALTENQPTIAQLLLQYGASPNTVNNDGQSALHIAVAKRDEALVTLLLERKGIEVDKKDSWGYTPLMKAALSQHAGIMRRLLETGNAHINVRDEQVRKMICPRLLESDSAFLDFFLESGKISQALKSRVIGQVLPMATDCKRIKLIKEMVESKHLHKAQSEWVDLIRCATILGWRDILKVVLDSGIVPLQYWREIYEDETVSISEEDLLAIRKVIQENESRDESRALA